MYRIFKLKFLATSNLSKIFLFTLLLTFASSCNDEDFEMLKRKGNENSNCHQKDSTTSRDSSCRDSTYKDSTNRDSTSRDTIGNYDSCNYKQESYFYDIGIRNNLTFSPSDRVVLNYNAIGMNMCASNVYLVEDRKVSGSVVNISLKPIIEYEGCLCGQSLTSMYGSYQIKRENSSSAMTYNISYSDGSGTNKIVTFLY